MKRKKKYHNGASKVSKRIVKSKNNENAMKNPWKTYTKRTDISNEPRKKQSIMKNEIKRKKKKKKSTHNRLARKSRALLIVKKNRINIYVYVYGKNSADVIWLKWTKSKYSCLSLLAVQRTKIVRNDEGNVNKSTKTTKTYTNSTHTCARALPNGRKIIGECMLLWVRSHSLVFFYFALLSVPSFVFFHRFCYF